MHFIIIIIIIINTTHRSAEDTRRGSVENKGRRAVDGGHVRRIERKRDNITKQTGNNEMEILRASLDSHGWKKIVSSLQ